MISVILSILKFILIILACILGLLLLIICSILFVPIRYEVNAKLDKSVSGKVRVSWLLRLLSLKVYYLEEVMDMKFTILGIPISTRDKSDKKSTRDKDLHEDKASQDKSYQDKPYQDKSYDTRKNQETKFEKALQKRQFKDDENKPTKSKKKEVKTKKPDKKSKVLDILRLIRDFFFQLVNFIKSILIKIYNFLLQIDSEEKSSNRLIKIKTFIQDNKLGIKRLIEAVKDFLKHIFPKKFEGDIEFGTGDPSTTGQVLGLVSVLYGVYSNNIQLTPNFQEKIFKGKIFLSGRIRIFTIVIIVLKLLFDKNFRRLLNNYRVFKEDL